MLEVITSASVQDAEYPESLNELQQVLARRALAIDAYADLITMVTESMEIIDALNTWAWSDFSDLEPGDISPWLTNHPIMFYLTNLMRNLTTRDPEKSLSRSRTMIEDMANLTEDSDA